MTSRIPPTLTSCVHLYVLSIEQWVHNSQIKKQVTAGMVYGSLACLHLKQLFKVPSCQRTSSGMVLIY